MNSLERYEYNRLQLLNSFINHQNYLSTNQNNVITIQNLIDFRNQTVENHILNDNLNDFKDWLTNFLNDTDKNINLFNTDSINKIVEPQFRVKNIAKNPNVVYYVDQFIPAVEFSNYQIDTIQNQIKTRMSQLRWEEEQQSEFETDLF